MEGLCLGGMRVCTEYSKSDLVKSQRLRVGFECLFVVFLALLDEAKDVPAYVRREVEADALLHELETFLSSSEVGKNKTLHARCFCSACETSYKCGCSNMTYHHDWGTF